MGRGRKKRIYSSKYAFSSICTCEKCGGVYRRIAWNNRGVHSIVWRCCTRVEHGPTACDAPTVSEETLQTAVTEAINQVLGRKSTVVETLTKITEDSVGDGTAAELHRIDAEMRSVQEELARRAMAKEDYSELTDKVNQLQEEKQSVMAVRAADKGKQLMRQELIDFLDAQTSEVTEYDEQLVRRLIEGVTVHEDATFTVQFKSETEVKIA